MQRRNGTNPTGTRPAGGEAGGIHATQLTRLVDSLAQAKPNQAEYARLLQRFAAELGALRALVTPEQQREWLDPQVRVWMGEHARQGYRVAVPGVSLTP
jgi:hypothetical protein